MPNSQSMMSTTVSTEARNLRDLVNNSTRIGGSYGSLDKSTIQPTFYIAHEVESDDTLQRLSLKYSVNIQEIKRINKLWSDAELGLLEYIYIPVSKAQLAVLRTKYSTINILQDLPKLINQRKKLSMNTNTVDEDEATSSIQSSDSSTSLSTTTSTSYQDYFSKIDQQIQLTKKTLQSIDTRELHFTSESHEISIAHVSDKYDTKSTKKNDNPSCNNEQRTTAHRLSDNLVPSDLATHNSREKYISAALERIQREKDNLDEL
ncbi:unnamed protein product [Rotaria socialis]|uniref:LysM domain-containing protein n=1 Tax=Rotaria socialis TaxID=392032 RepID=A0A819YFQ8_9BILA|nr:unnamed protein product [Rotaria socialis]CAF4157586.1 unnamed protein product [Rotaria socialis]CAF4203948.1 unnamed protein product [Rotaria socialis]CAF4451239.1 unnamed protein product [Rotaria socialis]